MVKAADRQGQRAMTIVRDPDGLAEAAERARLGSRSGRVLYEEFVPGPEVTVNAFSIGGRFVPVAVTDRVHFEGVPGVARRHVYPAAADGAEAAAGVAEAAVAALGIDDGPSYVQLILADDGPRVIEVAARLGGGHDSEICRTAVGVDLAAAAVLAAVDRPVDPDALEPHPNGAAVIEFLAAPPGEVVSSTGPPEVCFYNRARPRVRAAARWRPTGRATCSRPAPTAPRRCGGHPRPSTPSGSRCDEPLCHHQARDRRRQPRARDDARRSRRR